MLNPVYFPAGDLFVHQSHRLAILEEESQQAHNALQDILKEDEIMVARLTETNTKLSEVEKELLDIKKEIEEKGALEQEVEKCF